jgi:hypothetical protein
MTNYEKILAGYGGTLPAISTEHPSVQDIEQSLPEPFAPVMTFLKEWPGWFERELPAPPQSLYHYTDGEGLLGILTSRSLHATHSSFLNDQTELLHSLLQIREIIQDPSSVGRQAGDPNNTADEVMFEVINNFYS